jgi:hypothetical protein
MDLPPLVSRHVMELAWFAFFCGGSELNDIDLLNPHPVHLGST